MKDSLASLPSGQTAVVVGLRGGGGMLRRLDSIGLRPGKTVRKVSSQFMGGPVTVLIDGRQVAMGRGIARRVQVRILPSAPGGAR
ncbi:MAG: ferrous iron transport protein A [Planctomycetes bacterium]|nr:ferrous iron transport protein A [Planctomycetota bacterium]